MNRRIEKLIKELPKSSGVYFFKDKNEDIIYIGKAKNIKKRIVSHFSKSSKSSINFYSQVKGIDFVKTPTEEDALILESELVKKYQPRYNIELKDDKNFLFVGITSEEIPRVFLTHQTKDPEYLYFGPFVHSKELKKFLFDLRKIVPYKTCKNKRNNPCFYYHIGQCFGHKEKTKKHKIVLETLMGFLKIYLVKNSKIECFDISNTQGTLSVGSLVYFEKGRPQKKNYKKFKVKTVVGPDDPKSIREVVKRRFAHKDWPEVDISFIDGGKTQISHLKDIEKPIIAIAKDGRNEAKLFSPFSDRFIHTSKLPEIVKKTILSLRDEAHRFAISYHRKRREKKLINY